MILMAAAVFFLARPVSPARAQFRATLTPTLEPILILSPEAGEVLQGNVAIVVLSDVPGFQSAELTFAYAGDPTGTWFLLTESDLPFKGTAMATWDTSTITDGEYDLRLTVFFRRGEPRQVIVPNLRVRNYTRIETGTPASSPTLDPVKPTETLTPTISPPAPTPTPLPTNPAIPGSAQTITSLGAGVGLAISLFAALGLYTAWRNAQRRR